MAAIALLGNGVAPWRWLSSWLRRQRGCPRTVWPAHSTQRSIKRLGLSKSAQIAAEPSARAKHTHQHGCAVGGLVSNGVDCASAQAKPCKPAPPMAHPAAKGLLVYYAANHATSSFKHLNPNLFAIQVLLML